MQIDAMTSRAQEGLKALQGMRGSGVAKAVKALNDIISSSTPLRTAVSVAVGASRCGARLISHLIQYSVMFSSALNLTYV